MGLETLGVRALVTFLLGPLILAAAWLGGYVFLGFATLVSVLALHEFYGLAEKKGAAAQKWLGLAAAAGLTYLVYVGAWDDLWRLLFGLALVTVAIELFRNKENALLNVSATVTGLLYVSLPLAMLPAIRQLALPGSRGDETAGSVVIMIFLSIWICDSAAYILGSRLGKHKLFPRVSPNKSVEGTVAGFLFALLTAWLCQVSFLRELPLSHALAVGAICGSFGQLSDLAESLFKRDAGVKDSSNLIPGHGGVLDRFDSELLAVPLVYFYLVYFVLG